MKATTILQVLFIIGIVGCNRDMPPTRLNLSVESNSESNVVFVRWEHSENENFESYEVYRHTSSGINDETGELLHITTNRFQNVFFDSTASPGSEYFYRVYHKTIDGNAIGSNIEDVLIQGINILINGGFEDLVEGEVDRWVFQPNSFGNENNAIEIVTDEVLSGDQSVRIYHDEDIGCWEQWITQEIVYSELEAGRTYQVQFNYKATYDLSQASIIIRNNEVDIWHRPSINYTEGDGWAKCETEIVLPENMGSTNFTFTVHFCDPGKHFIWLDDVVLKPI